MKTQWTKKDLQECIGLTTPIAWKELCLEINTSNSGVCRLYINGIKTPFFAGGYGYDRVSTVLNDFMNYYAGQNKYTCNGVGVESLIAQIDELNTPEQRIKLTYVCNTKNGTIFKVTCNK